jgi:signal transduction histidine kinase
MADCQPFSFDHRIVRPDGTIRVLNGRGRVETGEDGRPVRLVGIGHDITEQKEAEAQREELVRAQAARAEAEQANRGKDQFLAMLSHELRTPLNVALGWAHLLREGRGVEDLPRAVETIHRNLLMLSRLVSDIIDVSRITSGTLRLESGPVDLGAVTDAAIDMVRTLAQARSVTIDTRIPATVPLLVGDGRRLQQVVWNLLSNAVKFVPDGGRVMVSVAPGADHVLLVVEDDGPGIDPGFLPHVFEEFSQADPSPTRTHGGLGLGLSIARHLVALHGGVITAANRESGGAVFTVHLPLQPLTV